MSASTFPLDAQRKVFSHRASFKSRQRATTACRLARGFAGIVERLDWNSLPLRDQKALLHQLERIETQLRRKSQDSDGKALKW